MRRTLLLWLALGSLPIQPAAARFTYEGNGWRVTVGEDGLLRSLRLADTELLQPFPQRESACLIFDAQQPEKPLQFDTVRQTPTGSVEARHAEFAIEYLFAADQFIIRYRNQAMGKQFVIVLRPSAAVVRAVDGEDDTTVDIPNAWYDDMVNARWVVVPSGILTIQMAGYWTRLPYSAGGVPCYGATVYQRQEGEWIVRPESDLSPRTALVFEVKGENEDFLPPGGAPARFPCATENLGRKRLEISCRTRLLRYPDLVSVSNTEHRFVLEPATKATVPLRLEPKQPGVYRAELELRHQGRLVKNKAWNFCHDFAAWQPRCPKPDDFDLFWKSTLAELERVPLDLRQTVLSDDPKTTLYKLDFAVLHGERAYAWLRVPKGDKGQRFPARLEFPPSGVNPIPPPPPTAAVEMKLAIHGYDVDLSNLGPTSSHPWPGLRYHNVGLDKKETYFFRNVYARCVRAVDVLATLPEVQPGRLMVFGGSQGGGLAIVAAALNPKVAFTAPALPGLCRLDWTVRHGIGSWPLSRDDVPNEQTMDQMLETLSYFDVANFIGQVQCPIVGAIGWMDSVTAAAGQIAAFAQADKDKLTLHCAPWGRHGLDSRTQNAFYAAHGEFLAGNPLRLRKTWTAAPETRSQPLAVSPRQRLVRRRLRPPARSELLRLLPLGVPPPCPGASPPHAEPFGSNPGIRGGRAGGSAPRQPVARQIAILYHIEKRLRQKRAGRRLREGCERAKRGRCWNGSSGCCGGSSRRC